MSIKRKFVVGVLRLKMKGGVWELYFAKNFYEFSK